MNLFNTDQESGSLEMVAHSHSSMLLDWHQYMLQYT